MKRRFKDNYYSDIEWLNVLTDKEFNELVLIKDYINMLKESLLSNNTLYLKKWILNDAKKKDERSIELIKLAIYRLNKIINLCNNEN